jgi:hypothetical protein
MSFIQSGKGNTTKHRQEAGFYNLVSMNAMFNESMKKAQACYVLPDIIVRCEALPQVNAPSEDVIAMFDNVLGTIFKTSPNGGKLFLHVDVEKEKMNGNLPMEQFENFTIRLHTNLTTNDGWRAANAAALSRASEIISRHNWIFGVNNIFQTGCLFTITVKGKFD